MNRKQGWGPVAVATLGLMIASLAACGGSPDLGEVEGKRDDVKYVGPVYKTKKSGKITTTVVDKPAKWCVELDDVNGDKTADDRWFRVDSGTHQLAVEIGEGAPIRFTPQANNC